MLLKSLRNIFLFASLLLIWKSSLAYTVLDNENSIPSETTKEKPFEMNTYSITKPLLSKLKKEVKEIYEIIETKDSEIKELNEIKSKYFHSKALIQELRAHNSDLQSNHDFLSNAINNLTNNLAESELNRLITLGSEKCIKIVEEVNSDIDELRFKSESEAAKLQDVKDNLDTIYTSHTAKSKEDAARSKYLQYLNSCIPFADDPGSHEISVPGNASIQVLCDSETVGPGWTVILQKINGKVDFDQDWESYSMGFGSFDGDFFLGLETIHYITKSQRYELYVHMKDLDGSIKNARYDDFKIGSEDEGYKLYCSRLESGFTMYDFFEPYTNQKFTTYDSDNDDWKDGNCAYKCQGGWWHKDCEYNKNDKKTYYEEERYKQTNIYCDGLWALKEVKILMRPKF